MTLYTQIDSPVGQLTLTGTARGLTGIWFDTPRHVQDFSHWRRDDAAFAAACTQLAEYFAGTRKQFSLPLAAEGTPFQQRVWAALCEIPFGETTSYGVMARALGDAKAMRAVGTANGRNPIGIVVPCHRVIGKDGSMTGYAGGIERKQWLLAHEARYSGKSLFA